MPTGAGFMTSTRRPTATQEIPGMQHSVLIRLLALRIALSMVEITLVKLLKIIMINLWWASTGTYGVTTSGSALTLKFVTQSAQKNVGSRLYLMAPGSTTEYQQFKLINQEFTFDVDVSQLPCGLNGAVYFSQMDADGGVVRVQISTLSIPRFTQCGQIDAIVPFPDQQGRSRIRNWILRLSVPSWHQIHWWTGVFPF